MSLDKKLEYNIFISSKSNILTGHCQSHNNMAMIFQYIGQRDMIGQF